MSTMSPLTLDVPLLTGLLNEFVSADDHARSCDRIIYEGGDPEVWAASGNDGDTRADQARTDIRALIVAAGLSVKALREALS